MSILSCKEFCNIINNIEKMHNFEDKVDNLCKEYGYPYVTDVDSVSNYIEDLLLNTLGVMFNCGDIINWWIFETDFGHRDNCWIEENGRRTYLRTVFDLYDFLTTGE